MQLQRLFEDRYGASLQPIRHFFAPGRVNLIGDHTDYNGGLVFPCAIDYGTSLLIRPTREKSYQLASTNFDLFAVLSADQTNRKYGDHWINYPLGVLQQLEKHIDGKLSGGFECLYSGNLPNGAGLSSSAAIEVVTAFALNALFDLQLDREQIIQIALQAENDFVGVQCGIMDQYAVTMGHTGHAMQLDCQTLDCQQIPLLLGDYRIVLINTNQRRELSESHYNQRVLETRQASDILTTHQANGSPPLSLASVGFDFLHQHKDLFSEQALIYQRARHVVTEHQRVVDAVTALQRNDLTQFGRLMYASHASLRDDYGVSSTPLDTLVTLAHEFEGVIGARLTGAGFGGCTVNIVHNDTVGPFSDHLQTAYQRSTGLTADIYLIEPSQGVHEINHGY